MRRYGDALERGTNVHLSWLRRACLLLVVTGGAWLAFALAGSPANASELAPVNDGDAIAAPLRGAMGAAATDADALTGRAASTVDHVVEPATKALAEVAAEPVAEVVVPAVDSVVAPVVEVVEPVLAPVADSVLAPVADSVVAPVVEVVEPVLAPVADSVLAPLADSVVAPVLAPVARPLTWHVAKRLVAPAPEADASPPTTVEAPIPPVVVTPLAVEPARALVTSTEVSPSASPSATARSAADLPGVPRMPGSGSPTQPPLAPVPTGPSTGGSAPAATQPAPPSSLHRPAVWGPVSTTPVERLEEGSRPEPSLTPD